MCSNITQPLLITKTAIAKMSPYPRTSNKVLRDIEQTISLLKNTNERVCDGFLQQTEQQMPTLQRTYFTLYQSKKTKTPNDVTAKQMMQNKAQSFSLTHPQNEIKIHHSSPKHVFATVSIKGRNVPWTPSLKKCK